MVLRNHVIDLSQLTFLETNLRVRLTFIIAALFYSRRPGFFSKVQRVFFLFLIIIALLKKI